MGSYCTPLPAHAFQIVDKSGLLAILTSLVLIKPVGSLKYPAGESIFSCHSSSTGGM